MKTIEIKKETDIFGVSFFAIYIDGIWKDSYTDPDYANKKVDLLLENVKNGYPKSEVVRTEEI